MTHDEYKGLLAKIISDPDSAADTAASILDEIDKDFAYIPTAKQTIAANEEKIKDLTSKVNSYKAREFLGVMGAPDVKQEEKPKEKGIDWDALLSGAEENTNGK